MQQQVAYETVVAYLPASLHRGRRLGLLPDLRGVVAMARRRYPQLMRGHVVEVGLKHEGDRVKAVVKFALESS